MRRRDHAGLSAFAAIALSAFLIAPRNNLARPMQQEEFGLQKGAVVTLKISASLFEFETRRVWDSTPIYVANIGAGSNGVTVAGRADWTMEGFPSRLELRVEKADVKDTYTEIELRNTQVNVKLRFSKAISNLPAALHEVVALGTQDGAEMAAYMERAYQAFSYFLFTGPLAEIPEPDQRKLLLFAHITAGGLNISHEEFRGDEYLAVDLGDDGTLYNTLQLDQAQRIAKILNDRLLTTLKAFAEPIRDIEALQGIKFNFRVGYKSFLDQASLPDYDTVRIYASSEDVKGFADFDLTSQEFVDRCFIIVNDNRIRLPLTSGGR